MTENSLSEPSLQCPTPAGITMVSPAGRNLDGLPLRSAEGDARGSADYAQDLVGSGVVVVVWKDAVHPRPAPAVLGEQLLAAGGVEVGPGQRLWVHQQRQRRVVGDATVILETVLSNVRLLGFFREFLSVAGMLKIPVPLFPGTVGFNQPDYFAPGTSGVRCHYGNVLHRAFAMVRRERDACKTPVEGGVQGWTVNAT
jgi:hypothetical protein